MLNKDTTDTFYGSFSACIDWVWRGFHLILDSKGRSTKHSLNNDNINLPVMVSYELRDSK